MAAGTRAFIDPGICQGCKMCKPEKECGANAIIREDEDVYVSPFCSGCRICLNLCPHKAIKLV